MLNMCINCGSISQNSPSSLLFNHSLVQRSQYSLNIARFKDERVPCTVNSVKITAIFLYFYIYLFNFLQYTGTLKIHRAICIMQYLVKTHIQHSRYSCL